MTILGQILLFGILLTMGRVYSKIDWNVGNTLVASCHTIRLRFDFLSNFIKVGKLFPLLMKEFSIFCAKRQTLIISVIYLLFSANHKSKE